MNLDDIRKKKGMQTTGPSPRPQQSKPPGQPSQGRTLAKPAAQNQKPTPPAKKRARFPTLDKHEQRKRDAHLRLPHGSCYEKTYDAQAVLWTGKLTVPQQGKEPLVFVTAASGSFRVEHTLDKMYRDWMDQHRENIHERASTETGSASAGSETGSDRVHDGDAAVLGDGPGLEGGDQSQG